MASDSAGGTLCSQSVRLPHKNRISPHGKEQKQKLGQGPSSEATDDGPFKGTQPPQHFVLHLPAEGGASLVSTDQTSVDGPSSDSVHQFYFFDQQHHSLLSAGIPSPSVVQDSQTVPVQLLSLSDGTAVPVNGNVISASSFIQLSGDNRQLIQTVDGQTIELVPANGFHFADGVVQSADEVSSEGTSSSCGASQHIHNFPTTALLPTAGVFSPQQVEPVYYVNEKQYNRILKRRAARAKLEMEGRIPKQRRKYLHESRHRHAQNRARRAGGKFDSGQPRAASSASAQGSEGGDQESPKKEGGNPPGDRQRPKDGLTDR